LFGCQKSDAQNVTTEKRKPKENTYETSTVWNIPKFYKAQPTQSRNYFALRIRGHHLLSYNVGNYAGAGRRT
jgi:hypothetical protein